MYLFIFYHPQQCAIIEGHKCESFVEFGVPQGTVLVPLFLLCINDLPEHLSSTSSKFAVFSTEKCHLHQMLDSCKKTLTNLVCGKIHDKCTSVKPNLASKKSYSFNYSFCNHTLESNAYLLTHIYEFAVKKLC